jgi:serine/threonine-protein kinase
MPDASDISKENPGKPGQFGRFYLQEMINSGGMAEIWLATDSSNRPYALRRMHSRYRFDFFAKRRFAKGCELLATISDHPAIISYVEHGKVSGHPYLLMEYVEAGNLKELYARHDPVLLENVAQILLDMAGALEHMHNAGYMHLDFKPENVLVTRNGSVRLVDFDLARPIGNKPQKISGKNPGTPAYMAPEQLQGKPITAGVDIFAYGVAAYELLTNQKPFPGETPGKILQQMLDRSSFVTPREMNPEMPASLEKIILRCLDPDPERRYPLIGIMVRELQGALYV